MKKILSILGTITLIGISTTSLVACNKKDNNENNEDNKSKKYKPKPEEPPGNSNWKLIKDYNFFVFNIDNKFYFFVFQPFNQSLWKILKFKHDTDFAKEINGTPFIPSDIKVYAEANKLKGLYRWDGNGIPETPEIKQSNGKITNWK